MVVDHPPLRRTHARRPQPAQCGRLLAGLVLALALAFSPRATAQVDALPDSVTDTVASLTEAQKQTVKSYADKYLALLESAATKPEGDPTAENARRMLVAPLARNSVSTTFRLEYSRQVIPRVRPLMQGNNKNLVTQALQITGEMATVASVEATLALLGSAEEDIRFMAAAGLRRTFVAVAMTSPAVDESSLRAAITSLGQALAAEKSELVAFAMTDSLTAAVSLSRQGFEAVPSAAAAALADALGTRVRALRGAMPDIQSLQAIIKAATSFRDALANDRLDASAAKAAAGFAGDLHVNLANLIKKGALPQVPADEDSGRSQAVQMALLADQIITFASQKRGSRGPAVDLSNKLRSGLVNDDATYAIGVNSAVEQLTGPTFGFESARFK